MTVYCDITAEPECIGIIPNPGVEVIFTGVELHTEPSKYRTLPLAVRLAQECDVHFWFDDEKTEKPFYTVPKTEVLAHDSRGGYVVVREGAAPLYYISPGFSCHRIVSGGGNLTDMGSTWWKNMIPCEDVEVFPSRAAAEEKYRILTLQQLLEEEP